MLRIFMLLFAMLLTIALHAKPQDSLEVVVFLSEKCPICQSITTELKKLSTEYSNMPVRFVGMFPKINSSPESISTFQKKYSMPFPLMIDEGGKKAKELKASITPEVFVINRRSNEILYSGKIDNSFESLGQQRTVITQHYLQQALTQIFNHKTPDPAHTKAVGCLIL